MTRLQIDSGARKVLIYRIGSLGDTVVAMPCFHLIARAFPNAERRLLTNFPVHTKAPASAAVLGDSGLVHEYMRYTIGTRSSAELLQLAWRIRRFHPDVLVYLMPVRPLKAVSRDRSFFRLAGVRRIVGLPGEEELKHRFDPSTGLYESEASRLARSIAALGDANPEVIANWNLKLNEAEMSTAGRWLGELARIPLIACAPGCKMQANDWGRENWRALLGRLYRKYPSCGLVLAGAKDDVSACDYAALEWAGPKLNLAGNLSPRESAAVFSHARIFIGPDSGPKHLAASVGTPCVCVFSARNLPGVWFPPGNRNTVVYHKTECFGCRLETCIEMENKCIRLVTVDEMEQGIGRILDRILPVRDALSAG
jgi:lipopolysaccharide heptosyltransferase III